MIITKPRLAIGRSFQVRMHSQEYSTVVVYRFHTHTSCWDGLNRFIPTEDITDDDQHLMGL